MSPGAAAAVTVSSVKIKLPICVTLSRNPFSGRNAVERANRRRGCWRFLRSVAPKLLASAYTLPAGFLALGSKCDHRYSTLAPAAQRQSREYITHLGASAIRACNARASAPGNAEEDFNTRTSVGTNIQRFGCKRSKTVAPQKTYYGHHDAVNLSTREFALRDDRFVAAKARDS